MTEELADEIEALNSIYGDNSLVSSDENASIYILRLPGETESSSLRIQFPPTYPGDPPAVLGTHSSGEHARRGAAARELELFREALGLAFQPGQVCLFDAIEELNRLRELQGADEQPPADAGHGAADSNTATASSSSQAEQPQTVPAGDDPDLRGPDPPWIMSDPVTEMKSTFVARCARVASTADAKGFLQHLLASDRRVRSATHNITAWRIRGAGNASFQDCDDDGETAAGGRLLHLMQLMDLWDAMVVVTRWYGGQKLGPRRFAVINQVARDAFIKAGLVSEPAPLSKNRGTRSK